MPSRSFTPGSRRASPVGIWPLYLCNDYLENSLQTFTQAILPTGLLEEVLGGGVGKTANSNLRVSNPKPVLRRRTPTPTKPARGCSYGTVGATWSPQRMCPVAAVGTRGTLSRPLGQGKCWISLRASQAYLQATQMKFPMGTRVGRSKAEREGEGQRQETVGDQKRIAW